MKILFLDFCSEKNRGDAAIQVGLIKLANKYFPGVEKISALTVFGANQEKNLYQEFDHSIEMDVELLGGLIPTFYPLGKNKPTSEFLIEALNALFFIPNFFFLFFLFGKLPPKFIAQIMPKNFKKSYQSILEADCVIWRGRNFRSRNNPLLEIYRTLYRCYHPLLIKALNKPLVCLGASVWDLNSRMSKKILRSSFEHCDFISLRELKSYTSCKKLLNSAKKIQLLPDLAYAAFNLEEPIFHTKKKFTTTDFPLKIGITLMDWKSSGLEIRNTYIISIRESIRQFINKGSEIILIPQATKTWEHFDTLMNELNSGFSDYEKEKISIINGEPHIEELLKIYSEIDFLIATRMHSAIFASAVQTPVVAIAYDSGGKWGILEALGLKEYIIPYSEISSTKLINNVNQYWKNRSLLAKNIKEKVNLNISEVNDNFNFVREIRNTAQEIN